MPTGLASQFVLIPLLYLPLRALLEDRDMSRPARELLDCADGAGLVALAMMVVVGASLVEELFFRGLLLRALQNRIGTAGAVVVSSVIFGATHFQALQFPGLAAFGLVLAVLTVRTGRLGPAIFAHAAFNAGTVVALVLSR